MKRVRHAGGPVLTAALVGALALAAGPPAERTLFKALAPSDPVREVIQALFDRPAASVRRGFTDREWIAEGFGSAWDRARRYFPERTYFVRPGTYFMTHGFDAEGRLFMEIHDSDYLRLCARNRGTFTAGGIVADYARMRGADDGLEAAAFRDKMGRLEPAFRDEASERDLREALGPTLYRQLLEELRAEDSHMLAGGLVHEGVHAGVDDAAAARLQAGFRDGGQPVQWDELRAFMAESVYHDRFCSWAARVIAGSRGGIEASLKEIERLRRRPRLRPGPDRLAFERGRARAWAFAALARLRMRESWQSALRLQALILHFRRDYLRGAPPADVAEDLAALDRETSAYVEAFGRAAQGMEMGLRTVEETLDFWTDWAAGGRPFPPPNTDSFAAVREMAAVVWPDPPVEGGRALTRRAEQALAAERPAR